MIEKGFFTFYGGHDPEDYQHYVNEEPTDLNLHPNSSRLSLDLKQYFIPSSQEKETKNLSCFWGSLLRKDENYCWLYEQINEIDPNESLNFS